MLDQLKMLVKEYADDTIVRNPAVPEQHKLAAVKDVTEQIFFGLREQAKTGNVTGLISLFEGTPRSPLNSDPLIKDLVGSVATSLTSKFGITAFASHQIATRLLPDVLDDFSTLKEFNLQATLEGLGSQVEEYDLAEVLADKTGNRVNNNY